MKKTVKQRPAAPGEPKRRGRPPSAEAREAILAAARELLAEGGLGAVTVEAVAERAGVGKPTIYRYWPDRLAVAMAALMHADQTVSSPKLRPSPLASLQAQLEEVAARFATPTGRQIASMLAAADRESELSKAFRNHFALARRAEGKAWLAEAARNGEIRPDVDVDIVADGLYGAVFFRLLMGHAPIDRRFVRELFAQLVLTLGQGRAGRRKAPRARGSQ